jgi:hypothetical protein
MLRQACVFYYITLWQYLLNKIEICGKTMFDIKNYKAGRFAYLMEKPFAKELWEYVASEKNVSAMLVAADSGKPAIEPLLADIESRFGPLLASAEYPDEEIEVFINNMIRQLCELSGYELVACGLVRNSKYIKSSGLFKKRGLT